MLMAEGHDNTTTYARLVNVLWEDLQTFSGKTYRPLLGSFRAATARALQPNVAPGRPHCPYRRPVRNARVNKTTASLRRYRPGRRRWHASA
jgi:hypothetical protein